MSLQPLNRNFLRLIYPFHGVICPVLLPEHLQVIAFAFVSIFLMELGDKTQLTSFTLSIRFKSPIKVFLGIVTGLVGVTVIAILIGSFLKTSVNMEVLSPLIGSLFIVSGAFLVITEIRRGESSEIKICPVSFDVCQKPRDECDDIENCEIFLDEVVRKGAFYRSMAIIFAAEIGDKTMLMSLGLSTQLDPIAVFIGAVLALIVVNGLGVLAGNSIAQKIPRRPLGIFSGLLFVIIGGSIILA